MPTSFYLVVLAQVHVVTTTLIMTLLYSSFCGFGRALVMKSLSITVGVMALALVVGDSLTLMKLCTPPITDEGVYEDVLRTIRFLVGSMQLAIPLFFFLGMGYPDLSRVAINGMVYTSLVLHPSYVALAGVTDLYSVAMFVCGFCTDLNHLLRKAQQEDGGEKRDAEFGEGGLGPENSLGMKHLGIVVSCSSMPVLRP
jgi:hypothetical protein